MAQKLSRNLSTDAVSSDDETGVIFLLVNDTKGGELEMAWKLAKDYSNPMWGPKAPRVPRAPRAPRPPKPPEAPRPPKPPAPPGYRYVWRKNKWGY